MLEKIDAMWDDGGPDRPLFVFGEVIHHIRKINRARTLQ